MATERPNGGRGPNLLRELSEQAVLETVFRGGPVTRPGIAARTGPTRKESARALDRQVHDRVRDAIARAGATHGQLLALGVATPGVVDPATSRVTSLAYNVTPDGAFDPLALIRYDVPLLVDNNINLSAVGEKWRGLARGVADFVFVHFGAGVG